LDNIEERYVLSGAPRISVVMPAWNAARWIDEAIGSVRSQTDTSWELIVVDDGSDDSTSSIVLRHAQEDSRIILLTGTRAGLVAALRRGVAAARAEFIARMDADDVCHPERFERQLAYLDVHPDVAVLGTAIRVIDANGEPTSSWSPPTRSEGLAQAFETNNEVAHPTVMARRSVIQGVGSYRPYFTHAEDLDLWLRVLDAGFVVENLPDALLDYRSHSGSVSAVRRRIQSFRAFDARLSRELRRAGLPDPFDEFREPPDDAATDGVRCDLVPDEVLSRLSSPLVTRLIQLELDRLLDTSPRIAAATQQAERLHRLFKGRDVSGLNLILFRLARANAYHGRGGDALACATQFLQGVLTGATRRGHLLKPFL
jgi:glycosyltransferase involved in cell wall biosynthesis